MVNLKQTFEKESRPKKVVLVAAAVVFISMFLPWMSVSYGGFKFLSENGWAGSGYLTGLASIAMILVWLLPNVGVKFTLPLKEDVLQKILSVLMLAGPVLWILDAGFEFAMIGWGLYVALAAGAVATYFSFVGGAKTAKPSAPKPPETPQA